MSTMREHFEHREMIRDVRPFFKRVSDSFMEDGAFMVLGIMAAACFLFPAMTVPLLIVGIPIFWFGQRQVNLYGWPIKAPAYLDVEDPAELDPVSGKPRRGTGIFLLGWERFTGRPLLLTNSDLRAHLYLVGVSGAGKTEGLLGVIWNALMMGSGLILIDGKGEISIPSQVIALARAFAREDDVLIVNFQTGGKDRVVASERRTSNVANLLALGASTELSEMMTALLDSGPNTDQMWVGRTESLIKALMPSLVWLRDHQNEPLAPSRFRSSVELREIVRIYRDERIPERIRAGLEGYLKTLPGGIPKAEGSPMSPQEIEEAKQQLTMTLNAAPPAGVTAQGYAAFRTKIEEALHALEQGNPAASDANEATREEQHGYVIMQLTKSLGIMADTYWYITDSSYTEIDWVDVALNRRIVIVLLPTLGLSKQGAESLGKIVTASVKAMMNRVLGDSVERRVGDPRFLTATAGNHPFFILFDEKPAYIVEGEDVIATQARSLGFAVGYGAQAHSHMLAKSEETAKAIAGAATRCKVIAGVEDIETMEMAQKLGGEVWRPVMNAYEYDMESEFGGIRAGPTVSVQKDFLVSMEQLKVQKEGQAHIFMTLQRKTGEIQRLVKANLVYVKPREPDAIHIQHLLPILSPGKLPQVKGLMLDPITGSPLQASLPAPKSPESTPVSAGGVQVPGGVATAPAIPVTQALPQDLARGDAERFIFDDLPPNYRSMVENLIAGKESQERIEAAIALLRHSHAISKATLAGLPIGKDSEGAILAELLKSRAGLEP